MNKQTTTNRSTPTLLAAPKGILQLKCACGQHTIAGGECDECGKKHLSLQRATRNSELETRNSGGVSPIVNEVLGSPSQLVDPTTRNFTESRFRYDFSQVRVQSVMPPMMQTKLAVSEPGDEYEKDADQVADQVVRLPDPAPVESHRQPARGKGTVQRKRLSHLLPEVAPDLETSIHALKGGGHPLPAFARSFFEPRFGHDFSLVRLHNNARAADVARELRARAYTVGTDIAFGAEQYSPETLAGRHLLAHELTHVVQQRQGAGLKIRLSHLRDFNDKDEMHDPSKLSDAQIEATDEFKAYMDSSLVWQWKDKVTREEALLTCRLILRHLREGKAVAWSSDARVFMNLARSQVGTLKKTEGEVGKLEWVPFSTGTAVSDPSKLESDFGKWMLAGGPEPDAGTGKVNCWEMVIFSAFKGGFTSKAKIEGIYNEAVKQVKAGTRTFVGDTIEVELRRGNEYVFDPKNPKSPEPLPGDIIIFTKAKDHVAISLGTKDGSGRHKIISHWPPPNGSHKTKETTIEELLPSLGSGTIIKFWSPKW